MKLWKHQIEMIDYALEHSVSLFDCGMGTGKSRSVVEIINRTKPGNILIVCPLAVVSAWENQLNLYSEISYTAVFLNIGGVKKKQAQSETARLLAIARGEPGIHVVNYETVWRQPYADWVMKQRWGLIVADECHALKSPGGKASRFFARLGRKADRVLGLSGTPLPHSVLDAYGLYRFLDPSIYGTNYHHFKTTYAVFGGFENRQVISYKNMDRFTERLNKIRLYVSRDVLDLPEAVHTRIDVVLPPAVMKIYRSLEEDFYAAVDTGEVTASNALTKLLRLQQVTSGHVATDDGGVVQLHNEKAAAIGSVIDGIEKDEAVVIFCRFRHDLKTCHGMAGEVGRGSCELSGSRKELESWGQDKNVLAAQIRTAREGIDLTYARYCFYYSIGYSLAEYEQSLARSHRPGQTRTVFYYHVVAKGTIDEKVYAALKERKNVIDSILGIKRA